MKLAAFAWGFALGLFWNRAASPRLRSRLRQALYAVMSAEVADLGTDLDMEDIAAEPASPEKVN